MSENARVMGLDVGARRIGVALSDELGITAQPHSVVDTKDGEVVARLVSLCEEHGVGTVVVGMPLSMSGGDRGTSSRRAKALGEALESRGLGVIYMDERFTTTEAERVLVEGNVRRKDRKAVVDKVAASLILQGYLDGR